MKAKLGDIVNVHYAGKLKNGHIFDTSRDREVLKFTIGSGRLLRQFEEAVIDMSPGDIKTIEIAAENAYGKWSKEMVLTIEKSKFPQNIVPATGMLIDIGEAEGPVTSALITEVTDENVTIDANHPLAGEDLIFDIHLVEIL